MKPASRHLADVILALTDALDRESANTAFTITVDGEVVARMANGKSEGPVVAGRPVPSGQWTPELVRARRPHVKVLVAGKQRMGSVSARQGTNAVVTYLMGGKKMSVQCGWSIIASALNQGVPAFTI